MVMSLVINLGILFVFKYFNFVFDSLQTLLAYFSVNVNLPGLRVLLPVGISFYTFQSLSYTIDVYRGDVKPEKHFGIFALYVSFFPQLVAGPIERATHLLPQFFEEKQFCPERFHMGLQKILWGLFKKVVIADRLAMYVNSVYNNVESHEGLSFIIATYFFAFQIYCDFSGYSDMAIGSAKILGFDLMENFNRPYFASNIVDFWRRWHISLSTWLRDYLYIPLGGNRQGKSRTQVNLLITMLLGGLWHGANWTFVVWGGIHGVLLVLSKVMGPVWSRIESSTQIPPGVIKIGKIILTFHLVCFAWVFFRANSISDAFYILTHLFSGWPVFFVNIQALVYGGAGVLVLLFVHFFNAQMSHKINYYRLPKPLQWTLLYALVFSIILFGVDGDSQFIYFQF
jgi:D-alanyl-lipoteichoic acid acyltransferase DltB (MBOAT superfamily)